MKHASEEHWELPEPISVSEFRMEDGAIIYLRRHGNPSGPRVVLCHGNGFAIDAYYPFWSLLLDDFDVFMYDMRNHGWNPVGPIINHNIPSLVRDLDLIHELIEEEFGDKPKIALYHSVSALTTLLAPTPLLASPARKEKFVARVLFDPPMFATNMEVAEFDEVIERITKMALRRADHFDSTEQFSDLLNQWRGFNLFVPGATELYAKSTLRKRPDADGYELRCPREYEARLSRYFWPYACLVELDKIGCPTRVIGADPTVPYSFLPTFDMSQISAVDYDFIPDSTHMLQLEHPKECYELMLEFLDEQGLLHT